MHSCCNITRLWRTRTSSISYPSPLLTHISSSRSRWVAFTARAERAQRCACAHTYRSKITSKYTIPISGQTTRVPLSVLHKNHQNNDTQCDCYFHCCAAVVHGFQSTPLAVFRLGTRGTTFYPSCRWPQLIFFGGALYLSFCFVHTSCTHKAIVARNHLAHTLDSATHKLLLFVLSLRAVSVTRLPLHPALYVKQLHGWMLVFAIALHCQLLVK